MMGGDATLKKRVTKITKYTQKAPKKEIKMFFLSLTMKKLSCRLVSADL